MLHIISIWICLFDLWNLSIESTTTFIKAIQNYQAQKYLLFVDCIEFQITWKYIDIQTFICVQFPWVTVTPMRTNCFALNSLLSMCKCSTHINCHCLHDSHWQYNELGTKLMYIYKLVMYFRFIVHLSPYWIAALAF